ncbi:MAG: hypothetical protein IH586_09760, partial [Anaerolineaceae bacterium]|nr:hypothetical protein [Anaerolineaceae bacterium]
MINFAISPPKFALASPPVSYHFSAILYDMNASGFWWILLSVVLYGVLHSILAASRFKAAIQRLVGQPVYLRFYRLFFAVAAGLTFLPSLALVALLPDRPIYTIPDPWKYLTALVQLAALVGLFIGVSQTGAFVFLGITQAISGPMPEKLVRNGL